MERRDDVELVHGAGAAIGEGPVWEERSGTLVWVDIAGRLVHRYDPERGPQAPLTTPLDVGAAVPRRDGGLVLALQDGFWLQDPGEVLRPWVQVEAADPGSRFNDGKCDHAGRFWAGTMELDGADDRGRLYRLDPDGTVTSHLAGIAISNGLAWSADRRTMFYIDSRTYRVDALDFEEAGGTLSNRRPVVTVGVDDGMPDGMTIDAEGGLWVAFWGGSSVRRFDPTTGECSVRIELPAPHVTSCAFGGPDLDELYITSAARELDADGRAAHPDAGGLFRIRPGVRGVPTDLFAG
jgi:sugar lactone lactonase YvrE